jgi:hypothetical protein
VLVPVQVDLDSFDSEAFQFFQPGPVKKYAVSVDLNLQRLGSSVLYERVQFGVKQWFAAGSKQL